MSEEREIERVHTFFARYAERFNRALAGERVPAKEVAASYARYFVSASPAGIAGGRNGLLLRFMIPRGFARYRRLGTKSMNVSGIDVVRIDPLHVLATVHWDSRYQRRDGTQVQIAFDVSYMLQFQDGEPKIFAYVSGDEERVLREHGLMT